MQSEKDHPHLSYAYFFLLRHLFLVLLAAVKRAFQPFASYPQMTQAAIQTQLSRCGSCWKLEIQSLKGLQRLFNASFFTLCR